MASLLVTTEEQTVSCGGTYIGTDGEDVMVLTAGHCLSGDPSVIRAYFRRETMFASSAEEIGPLVASQYFLHSDFEDNTASNGAIHNDMGLVRFPDTSLPFDPVTLASAESEIDHGASLSAAGWGVHSADDTSTNRSLQVGNLSAICLQQCSHALMFSAVSLSESQHLCAGRTGVSICYGDSGGPLLYYAGASTASNTTTGSYVQVGISSFSAECDASLPDVFTRVSSYESLIGAQVSGLQTSKARASGEGICDLTFKLSVSFSVIGFCCLLACACFYLRRRRLQRDEALRRKLMDGGELAAPSKNVLGDL